MKLVNIFEQDDEQRSPFVMRKGDGTRTRRRKRGRGARVGGTPEEQQLGTFVKDMYGNYVSNDIWMPFADVRAPLDIKGVRTASEEIPEDVKQFLDTVVDGEWTYTPEEEVIVKGDVDLTKTNIDQIPVKFVSVTGVFKCNSELKTLYGSPFECGSFILSDAKNLKSLKGCSREIHHVFKISNLQLAHMDDAPGGVGEVFVLNNSNVQEIRWPVFQKNGVTIDISNTNIKDFNELFKFVRSVKTLNADNCKQLSTLEGLPQYVINLLVNNCNLTKLDVPNNVKMIKNLHAKNNPFTQCPPEKPEVVENIEVNC